MSNELAEIVDAGSLASFETAHAPKQMMPVLWSIEKFTVAQDLALSGKTKKAIAKEHGIPLTAINTWLKHPDFQTYIADIVMEGASAMKGTKLKNLQKALKAREDEAEENGWGSYTGWDTLKIHEEIRKEMGDEKTADSSYTSLLEKLVTNSMKQPKTIVVEDIQ